MLERVDTYPGGRRVWINQPAFMFGTMLFIATASIVLPAIFEGTPAIPSYTAPQVAAALAIATVALATVSILLYFGTVAVGLAEHYSAIGKN